MIRTTDTNKAKIKGNLDFWFLFSACAGIAILDGYLFVLGIITGRADRFTVTSIGFALLRWSLVFCSPFVSKAIGAVMLVTYVLCFLVFLSRDVGT
jgi:hypothetical protein